MPSQSIRPSGTGPLRWNSCTDILSRTIWGLGREGGQMLMHAMACVFMNQTRRANQHFIQHRAHHPDFGDGTMASACLKRACWQRHDPLRPQMERVTTDDPDFELAIRIAALACEGKLEPIVAGANQFISQEAYNRASHDDWIKSLKPVRIYQNYVFLQE